MKLTIKQIDKKMNDIESYYNQFNMCSYEYPIKNKIVKKICMNLNFSDVGCH